MRHALGTALLAKYILDIDIAKTYINCIVLDPCNHEYTVLGRVVIVSSLEVHL